MLRSSHCLAHRRVFIAGGAITPFIGKGSPNFIDKKHPDFRKRQNPTVEEYITKVTNEALKATRCDPTLIDNIVVGNFAGELYSSQGHLGAAAVGANPSFLGKPTMRVEAACASGALAVQACHDSIRAGADIVLAIGAEVQNTVSARVGGDYLARAAHYARQRSLDDFTFPCMFARRMKHIVEAGHFTMDDAALVSAKAYSNGNKNPLAHMNKVKLSFEQASTVSDRNPCFLGNAEYKDYIRMSDCSQVSDGASAVVLVSEEGAKKINATSLVEVIGLQSATGNLYEDAKDPTIMEASKMASAKAFDQAKIKPSDINVIELHDCFSVAELLMYEAMGICEYGKAKDLIRNGDTNLDGKIPVNTGGGLISFGHPVGATGVKQIMEIYRQMKGMCGEYQMKTIPAYGACLNMGGDDKTSVCTILKNI